MFKNLKIGAKLAVGFGLVLSIFIIVGGLSWINMSDVSNMSTRLANVHIPETGIANELERETQDLAYYLRGYIYTENKSHLDLVRERMDTIDSSLKEAIDHGKKYKLAVMVKSMNRASENFEIFKADLKDTVALVAGLQSARKAAGEALAVYMDRSHAFLTDQDKLMDRDVSLELPPEMIMDRMVRIRMINDIITQGNISQIAVIKAEQQMDPDAIMDGLKVMEKVEQNIKQLLAITDTDENRVRIKELTEAELSYKKAINDFVVSWKKLGDKQKHLNASLNSMVDDVTKSAVSGVEEADKIARSSASHLARTTKMLLTGFIIAILLGVLIAFIIARMIKKPLANAVSLALRAKEGDLSITREEFATSSRDEIGQLADALAEMLTGHREMILHVIEMVSKTGQGAESLAALSEETNASMEEIRAAVEQVVDLSESNTAALEDSNAGIQKVASGAQSSAQSATQGAEAANNTQKEAQSVVEQVEGVNGDINAVGEKSRESVENLTNLADSVKEIAKFVDIITGIADQTNLLALNAAIEAARAGDAGRGFAVVADEVRKLAEESNRSAKEVAVLISTLQENARVSMVVTKESGEIMEGTMDRSGEAHKKLIGMLKDIEKVEVATQNIASVSQEQAASTEEMAESIGRATDQTMKVGEMVENIKNSSEEATNASENVALEAQDMLKNMDQVRKLLAHFRLDSSDRAGELAAPDEGAVPVENGLVEI